MNDSLYIELKDDNGDINKKKKLVCFSWWFWFSYLICLSCYSEMILIYVFRIF